jgi:hypothetical protein
MLFLQPCVAVAPRTDAGTFLQKLRLEVQLLQSMKAISLTKDVTRRVLKVEISQDVLEKFPVLTNRRYQESVS